MSIKNIAVIGAGPMGLACAYELLKKGHDVTIYEADKCIGGMSASFDFDGLTIERYYHFICKTDYPLFEMLEELGIADHLCWQNTRMGFYYQGKLYEWGKPDSLLFFPKLNLISKMRYALHVLYSKSVSNWKNLDKIEATSWLQKWLGNKGYETLWSSLFKLKFFEYTQDLSAAWIAARVKRVANSRKNLFQEQLGYLKGGSETFLNALEKRILKLHGSIKISSPVQKVITENTKLLGLKIEDELINHDAVISTVPIQYVPRLVPSLTNSETKAISSIKNIAVACVILKLKHPISPYFWMNINDPNIEVPGIIEYSNLNQLGEHILYVPYYMPKDNPKYTRDNKKFFSETRGYLKQINSEFKDSWVLAEKLSRYEFAQTVCTPNFFAKLPPTKTSIEGFLMTDTSYYYPEDRSISESIRIGKELANQLC